MDATVTINVNEQVIRKIIQNEIDALKKEKLEGKTWSLDEFRAECAGGKARAWVKLIELTGDILNMEVKKKED